MAAAASIAVALAAAASIAVALAAAAFVAQLVVVPAVQEVRLAFAKTEIAQMRWVPLASRLAVRPHLALASVPLESSAVAHVIKAQWALEVAAPEAMEIAQKEIAQKEIDWPAAVGVVL